jgi:hypothetical protein
MRLKDNVGGRYVPGLCALPYCPVSVSREPGRLLADSPPPRAPDPRADRGCGGPRVLTRGGKQYIPCKLIFALIFWRRYIFLRIQMEVS